MRKNRIKALLLKYYYICINSADRFVDILYWPLIDLMIWGFASYYFSSVSGYDFAPIFVVGAILRPFESRGAQDLAIFLLEDYWSRNLYHLFASPLKISELIFSIIIVSIIRSIISFSVVAVIAWLLYSFNVLSIPINLLLSSILLLSAFGWSLGLFATSCIIRYGQRVQVLTWSIVWVFQPFSCVFYPFEALPPWAATIAKFVPCSYVYENLRNWALGERINYSQLLLSATLIMILLLSMSLFLLSSFCYAKRHGLLGKAE